jgi:hypothetical protein
VTIRGKDCGGAGKFYRICYNPHDFAEPNMNIYSGRTYCDEVIFPGRGIWHTESVALQDKLARKYGDSVGYNARQLKLQWGVVAFGEYLNNAWGRDVQVYLDNINVLQIASLEQSRVCADVEVSSNGVESSVKVNEVVRSLSGGSSQFLVQVFQIFPEFKNDVAPRYAYPMTSAAEEMLFVNEMTNIISTSVTQSSIVRVLIASTGTPQCGVECKAILKNVGGSPNSLRNPIQGYFILYGRVGAGAEGKRMQMRTESSGDQIKIRSLHSCQFRGSTAPENARTNQVVLSGEDIAFQKNREVLPTGLGVGVGKQILFGMQKGFPAVKYAIDRSTSGRLGCYLDSYYSNGDFELFVYNSQAINTPSMCRATCFEFGYPYAALRYYDQCWCGRAFGYSLTNGQSPGIIKVEDSRCQLYDARGDRRQAAGGHTNTNTKIYGGGWTYTMEVYETHGNIFSLDNRRGPSKYIAFSSS